MQLQITHSTCYDYVPAVEAAQHIAYLQPLNTATQQLLAHSLLIEPTPAQHLAVQDVYGNTRTYFALQVPHTRLTVVAHSVVRTRTPPPPQSQLAWETVRDSLRYGAHTPFDAAAEFVFASPHVPRHADFAAYAQPSFAPGTPLLQAARDLMQRIHRDFRYASQSTEVSTPALAALHQRQGVCQDFAHILIACLRAMGLPARYVSGYLLTQAPPGQPRLVGSDASHAWASVYVPELASHACQGWLDLDPTNNRTGLASPGLDYVRLAVGRDFADVSPLRGVLQGGGEHTLEVAVTVAPMDE